MTARKCRLDYCDRPRYSSDDLCAMHAARARHGIPMEQTPRIIGDDEARFWSKVTGGDIDTCWEWTASLNDNGYGQFRVGNRTPRAHRWAYENMIGPIPDELHIDHLCRNRACVNPWHLDVVTPTENTRRGVGNKGRRATTCRHGHPFSPKNTRIDPKGHQRCRTCERRHSLAGYYRRKARTQ